VARKKKIDKDIVKTEEPTDKSDFKPYVKVKIKTGDSLIRLPNRMIVVDGDWIVASRDEYRQLLKMGVC